MRKHKVVFRRTAIADLDRLYDDIAEQSGAAIAGPYIDRIEEACRALELFPNRGVRRDDIRRGMRTIGFERRATIAFEVTRTEVIVRAIVYGGQDLFGVLSDLPPD